MVRGLAHEIKNPLGGLRGAAQLLESELDSEELKEYTHIIIQEADRLQELVNRMLGPNRRPSYAPVNIHHVLERVRSLVLAETGERIDIDRDYDPSIPELIGDSDQLIQAVLNIVRNATRVLGESGTIELVITLGYFTMISMLLNVCEVPLPVGEKPPFDGVK